ncbi:Mu-like prophage major head subunit gpT [Mameliella alba]|uniref:Mu-like prophage major head subunit gpT family protein n=1 Tax=Mameliella alba TaxID=561184 RepID=UPI000886C8FC|nr:Mu-like prophage major head subunit gpT family protein [Mameliella alba]OWV48243.1 hypothetical protein CDZ96_10525 [Mameliella alba]PTR40284.1 Mu-like prophage major head subunit gpT [Mameliella alba]GGF43728.1 hypothetical protein GCM10011319_01930 [Mameliella alba]SDC98126.1 Mu-like prophage major head subunit gpT [Mameliella alba]
MSKNKGLSSRAIIGTFYQRLEEIMSEGWINDISATFESDQDSETYKWLGAAPLMTEWKGSRIIDGLRENGITIENIHWANGIGIPISWIRRDKTGQIMRQIDDLAVSAANHKHELIVDMLDGAEALVCYDGQYFFDTDHSEGESGTQSNDLSVDISALPASVHGSTTSPSAEEVRGMVTACIKAIKGFKDDRGRPMNRSARNFTVVVPNGYLDAAMAAIYNPILGGGDTNFLPNMPNYNITLADDSGLSWTDKLCVFRSDGQAAPVIWQQETEPQMKAKAEGSEEEFDNDRWTFGLDYWANCGPGFWQHACMATAT